MRTWVNVDSPGEHPTPGGEGGGSGTVKFRQGFSMASVTALLITLFLKMIMLF